VALMDWGNVAQLGSFGVSLVALAIAISTAISKNRDAAMAAVRKEIAEARKDTDDLVGRLNRHETRIASLEGDMRHLPNKEVVHQMQLSLLDLKGQLAVVIERVGPIKAIAERLQDAMMENGHK
jgi:septal ring factor EnvC (AmiA/AmiB activator)